MESECTNSDIEGAYVQKADPEDTLIYLVPLCKKHRESKEELEILDTCAFVSTNIKTTCGRSGSKTLGENEL